MGSTRGSSRASRTPRSRPRTRGCRWSWRRPPRPVRALHDRDHRLAGDVAAEDDDVRAVEGTGVQELLPADLRPVEVGHEEDLHRRNLDRARLGTQASAVCRGPNGELSARPPRGAGTTARGPRPWPGASTSGSSACRCRRRGASSPGRRGRRGVLGDEVRRTALRVEDDLLQVHRGGAPPPPVLADERSHPVRPDRARLVALGHRAENRWRMSCTSFRLSSKTWSFVSKRSATSSVSVGRSDRGSRARDTC